MRQKLHTMAVTTSAPLMGPGEVVQATGRAQIGKLEIGRKVAMMAATAILSGGTMMASTQKKAFFIVLTNQRLLVLEPHWLTSRPTAKIVGEIPRHLLTIVEYKRGVTASVSLAIGGDGQGLRLTYLALDKEGADNLTRAMQYQAA
ncbi:hypothetical protein [Dactylosporangium sp. CA-139066]|uniref:hypothetical protein n=1 Tax=Dactylosporangium sp. CA-139066 TaxID=3239930 RepID=UPI003D8C002D